MTRQDIATVACRLLALVLFYLAIGNIPAILWGINQVIEGLRMRLEYPANTHLTERLLTAMVIGCGPVVAILGGWLLWKRAESIGKRLLPDGENGAPAWNIEAEALLSVGLVVLGVVTLVQAAVNLGNSALAVVVPLWLEPGQLRVGAKSMLDEAGPGAIRLVLGLWLVIGRRRIIQLIRKVRAQPTEGLK